MPELPEVETVRRGLQPAMEGARFAKVEARRPDLRRPLPTGFVKRLEGRTVTGLGRRAKYLLADLSSGDVLLMHLGMSGSFRVAQDDGAKTASKTPGHFHYPRAEDRAPDQDRSSGDVLLMHLGMSGSFRVAQDDGAKTASKTPGHFHYPRAEDRAHD